MEVKGKVILFIDACEAHGLYGKKILKKNGNDFIVKNIKKIDTIDTCSKAFVTIVFIYGEEEELCKLLPVLNEITNLVICVKFFEIKWFSHYFSKVPILDINTPKADLFSQIKKHIQIFDKY